MLKLSHENSKLKLSDKSKRVYLTIGLLILFLWSANGTKFNPLLFRDFGNTLNFIQKSFLNPDWSVLPMALKESVITVQIAIMGTFLALILAIPISFLGAKNTSPHWSIYTFLRSVLSFIRSIPEIVFALIFVPTVSLGPFAGVLALMIHNIGVMGKLFSEIIESADIGPQEAVASTGAKKIIVILYGIVPQVIPHVLSNAFYRLEVSVRASLVLGLVGAGGVGQLLSIHFRMFQYNKVAVDCLVIMTMVIVIDYFGGIIRRRVI
ncbi:phosphonate ABC transporter, permease protein PhnE [Alkaliphilus peptidifermentans]|uniref:Phosphonate transport system permease protein n=1 Tax=Alkaliphilus peptidifermentans DSM 18978 TaxID=1120976 RepID=A0A1G5GLB8_9FIRM|nr:phosphonate ABC transporter, permease protein PhnE [Alkaliphilus peptidifermentans]SCY52323.1 phosphonate transport system permease protein [Alkaliphilus peptidifermentans DSM 18978]